MSYKFSKFLCCLTKKIRRSCTCIDIRERGSFNG